MGVTSVNIFLDDNIMRMFTESHTVDLITLVSN